MLSFVLTRGVCHHWVRHAAMLSLGVDVVLSRGCLLAVLPVGKLFGMLPVIVDDDGGGPGAHGDWTISYCHGDCVIGVSSEVSNV